jgi:hypothetical protein
MGVAMSAKRFSFGQRVRVRGTSGPGTIIGRGRSGIWKVWFVELDYAGAQGDRLLKRTDRQLEPLPPEQDPRLGRSVR